MGPVGSGGFCEAAGFDEGGRRQFGGPTWAVLDEGFHRFNEVGAKVEAVALAVFNEGVSDAAEFVASPGTKEHVVFGSDLQGPDRVFAELVAEFYPSVGEVAVQAAPVVQGVARGVQVEAGEDGFFDDFMAVPAFEAAVVFTFGRFALSFFSASLSASFVSSPEGESSFPGSSPSIRGWSWAGSIFSFLAP
jgi:hypothetical protein